MAISRINVGTLANDGTGDDLRQAFVKVNNNIDDLDARVQAQATAANLGSGTGVFASKESGVIGLKSLVAGVNVEITSDSSISIQTDGLFGSKFLLIELGGLDDYMEKGDSFSFAEDSILLQDLLNNIIKIKEKNKL